MLLLSCDILAIKHLDPRLTIPNAVAQAIGQLVKIHKLELSHISILHVFHKGLGKNMVTAAFFVCPCYLFSGQIVMVCISELLGML